MQCKQSMMFRATALVLAAIASGAAAQAAETPPDFSGVYAPVGLAGGRSPVIAPLQPEYKARWEEIVRMRDEGSPEFRDNVLLCLPPGMPYMMDVFYLMDITQVKDRMLITTEWNDAIRRIYLDGRKPTEDDLLDPTYAGFSTGRWEGDTLVINTVALRDDTPLDVNLAPHSDETTIEERIRMTEPGVLENRITVTDPKALTEPWQFVRTYRQVSYPNDQLREFACAEGLGSTH